MMGYDSKSDSVSKLRKPIFGAVALIVSTQQFTSNVMAEDELSISIEEVVVTATRRETSLQKTPVAITAFGEQALESFSIDNARDLMGMVPNLYAQRVTTSPSVQTYGMRGLGQSDQVGDPTVGMYVDDVYLPRNIGQLFDVPGIDQIEVLRGPQGTLYGRNSAAGAIKISTIKPDNTQRLKLSAGMGNFDAYEVKGFVSGPIIEDKVFASVAAMQSERDGYVKNTNTNKDVNALDQSAIRAKLRFVLRDDLEFVAIADYERDGSDALNYIPSAETTPVGEVFDTRVTYETGNTAVDVDVYGLAGKFIFDINDSTTLKSITSYRKTDAFLPNEFDGLPVLSRTQLVIDNKTLSQEFQLLTDFSWGNLTTGLFYFNEDYQALAQNALAGVGSGLYYGGLGDLSTTSYAAYGQATINVTDNIIVTIGGRYTDEDRDLHAEGHSLNSDLTLTALTYSADPSLSSNAFTPKVGLQYQWTPDVMTYVSYSEGFHAGGFSMRATSATVANLSYGNESVETYEAGVRASWLDGRVNTNLTAFYNDVVDAQVGVFLVEQNVGATQNAGSAVTKGVEFEMQARLTEGLMFFGNFGYLDASFTDWPNAFGCPANCTNGAGLDMLYAPDWTGNARLTYETNLNDTSSMGASLEVQHQSRAFTRSPVTVYDDDRTSSPGTYFNGSFWYKPNDQWTLKVAARNLTDEEDRVYNFEVLSLGIDGESYTVPRTVLFSVSYDY